jgi:uncharacterized membrane protein
MFIQIEGFGPWLFKQSVTVVILILAVIVVVKYFTKQTDRKDSELKEERTKHEENLKTQIDKGERRLDKFDAALERRDVISRDTAKAVELVGDRLRDLAEEIRAKRNAR